MIRKHTIIPAALRFHVYEAIGAATMCWEDIGGAGAFCDEEARQIAEELIGKIAEMYEGFLR